MTHPMDSVPMPEPATHQFQDAAGNWCNFISERHYRDTVADGRWPIRALYTKEQILSTYEMGRNAGLEEAIAIVREVGPKEGSLHLVTEGFVKAIQESRR